MPVIAQKYIVILVGSLLFIVVGAFIKKIIKGGGHYNLEDWFLGVELALSSLSSASFNILDKLGGNYTQAINNIAWSLVFILGDIFSLVLIVSLQQDARSASGKLKVISLCVISNLIGMLGLFIFHLVVVKQ
jgi:hypothetical protein